MNQQVICRIMEMEYRFDRLLVASPREVLQEPDLQQALQALIVYYDSGQWLADYTMDEQGLLPPWLKRGVLSQDGVYNLLARFTGICPTP